MTDAIIKTDFGSIKFSLLPDLAPETVRNFLELAKSGFYNGTLFHRVIPGFMIQGGDPNTKNPDKSMWGQGGPGYNLKAEFSTRSHLRGIVSMARAADPDSAGSQFFIVTSDSTFLDKQYTVFGEVVDGMEVADKIVNLPRDGNDCPKQEAKMLEVSNGFTTQPCSLNSFTVSDTVLGLSKKEFFDRIISFPRNSFIGTKTGSPNSGS